MGIYSEKVTLQLLAHLVGPSATLLTSAILAFPMLNFRHIFKGLPGLGLS